MIPSAAALHRLRMVFGWFAVLALWVVAGWWVVAVHPWAGPVLLAVTETHGLHVGDVPAVALGGLTTVWCWRTTTACRRSASS